MNTDESVLKQWFRRVWNEGDVSAIDELATPDVVSHGLKNTLRGTETWRRDFYEPMRQAFTDVHVEVVDEVANGDKIFGLQEATLTPRATGQPVKMRGSCLVRTVDGKIAEAWDSWDFLGLLESMQLMPADSLGRAVNGALTQHPAV